MHFAVAIIPIIIYTILQFVGRKSFKVHSEGIVLITGASTGIGRHAAEHLAAKHKFLVLAGVRKESDAQNIRNMNIDNLQPVIIDVNSHESCVQAVEVIKKLMDDLKLPFIGLVNNAGIGRSMFAEFIPVDVAKQIFNTNFFGVLEITQLTLPLLRASQGRIIMISSVSGMIATQQQSIYSASKFALEGFSDALRREVAQFGVSVSLIQPAYVKSAIHSSDSAASADLIKDPAAYSEMRKLYERFLTDEMEDKIKKDIENASEPEVTSEAIDTALTMQYPRTRYTVANAGGFSASTIAWLDWILTDRLQDMVLESL